jgi:hypothetical protein
VAALFADDPALRVLYDSGSPDTDRQNLAAPFAQIISARAKRSGFLGDPHAYATRLAAKLLPDVLQFDPARPVGFTFAARNGRHPADAESVVVNSILNGTVSDRLTLEAAHVTSL